MSAIREEFLTEVNDNLDARIEEQGMRPNIEVWPVDDEFARWVAYHEAKERAVICSTPEFKDCRSAEQAVTNNSNASIHGPRYPGGLLLCTGKGIRC